jgi:hypothetical protein
MLTEHDAGPKRDWSALPIHPVLMAAFPVVFLFAENTGDQLSLNPLWQPLGVAMAGAAILLTIGAAATRSWLRGALAASLLIALFFSFGDVWSIVHEPLGLSRRLPLVIAYGALAISGLVLVWRGGRWVVPVTRVANLAAVLLVAFNVVRIAEFAVTGGRVAAAVSPGSPEVRVTDSDRRPDIYYIILDRYANADTLKQVYGFDNSGFLAELERRGFTVVDSSWSNYFKTALSLSSSLNMDYLDGAALAAVQGREHQSFYPANLMLQGHLAVPATLKSIGYEYVQIGNWWEPSATNVDADVTVRFEAGAEFNAALLSTTAWMLTQPLNPPEAPDTAEARYLRAREHTLFAFDRLEDASGRPGPTYVFAHFLVPHTPYVFNADGTQPTQADLRARSGEESYLQQLRWANERVLRVLDHLLDVPPGEEPVIILQADEGPLPDRFAADEDGFDWLQATPAEISQKFGILNAVHLPGVDATAAGFHDRLSPVNTFRIVFNTYFGAELPLLPDRVYLSPTYDRLYDFVEYRRPS